MPYVKVAIPRQVEGPFDYAVPMSLVPSVAVGKRVAVNFAGSQVVGVIVGVQSRASRFKLKNIESVLDREPVFDATALALTKRIADYYACSWGMSLETALPARMRLIRCTTDFTYPTATGMIARDVSSAPPDPELVQGGAHERWRRHLEAMRETLALKAQVLILVPSIGHIGKIKDFLLQNGLLKIGCLLRGDSDELTEWIKTSQGDYDVVIGSRSAVFAPLRNIGLIIIEEESLEAYKQDQVPHYHARQVGVWRAALLHARCILAGNLISLEGGQKPGTVSLKSGDSNAELKVIDMRLFKGMSQGQNRILSKYLEDSIARQVVAPQQGRARKPILLFVNRKGFASVAYCSHCAARMLCPRCDTSLVYHRSQQSLHCSHCPFSMPLPSRCPACSTGLIRFAGAGTEKVENELARIFPAAQIVQADSAEAKITSADIVVASYGLLEHYETPGALTEKPFEIIGIIGIDALLNRVDFRAGEKAFALLSRLQALARAQIILQTSVPEHYCVRAIQLKDPNLFYEEEMRFRKQLALPPFGHLCYVIIRGPQEKAVQLKAEQLFKDLSIQAKGNSLHLVSVNPGVPPKLRGNFYYRIVVQGKSPERMSIFLKKHLKRSVSSGIIITIDMDPV